MRDDMKDRLKSKDQQRNTADWNRLTVLQLKGELKSRGLPLSGKKADLVERLVSYEETDGESGCESGDGSDSESDVESVDEEDDMDWEH
jgi:SAP domain-containing ribonucleoprotein